MKIQGPGESALLLLDVIKRLNQYDIPYAVIGSFAASFYGLVRASLDVDAMVSAKGREEKMEQLVTTLEQSGLRVEKRSPDSADPVRGMICVQDQYQNRVDLLTGIKGMPEDFYTRVTTAVFMGASVQIIGLEDFIAMKIFAGGLKDIQDATGVLKVSSEKMDLALLKRLTSSYGKKELSKLKEILADAA